MTTRAKPKLAFWWRYTPADNIELAHATPRILEQLAPHAEIHYFSYRGKGPLPEVIARHTVPHFLPFAVNRSSTADKVLKTLLWYLALPFIGLRCRFMGVQVVYIDDYLPVGSWLARTFSGAEVAIFVVDFLLDAYAEKNLVLRPLARLANAVDAATWRRLPLIFTRTKFAGEELHRRLGVPRESLRTAYDANNDRLYFPADRPASRSAFGYGEDDVVMVHHGVLHPNKGIDRVLRALVDIMKENERFHFLVVGGGPETERLQQLARELGLAERIRFTGWLPKASDVNMALNAADIGLVMRTGHATDHFHLTGALVHSMAVGLPVLAPRLSGIREVVTEGREGYLFNPNEMAEFQDRCRHLIAHPEERRAMGARALEQARKHFSLEHSARCVVEPLLELAGVEHA